MLLTEYHESQTRTGKPRVIARFSPAAVAQVLIAIVADLLPFINFLQRQAQATSASATYLWPNNGLPVPSDIASKALSDGQKYTAKFFTGFSAERNEKSFPL